MIEFVITHPIAIPFNKQHEPQFPLRLLLKDFERVRCQNRIIEVFIIDDKVVSVTNGLYLQSIRVPQNHEGFIGFSLLLLSFKIFFIKLVIVESIRIKNLKIYCFWNLEDLNAYDHEGVFRKACGSESMSKKWVNVVFSIFYGRSNVVDLLGVLWSNF